MLLVAGFVFSYYSIWALITVSAHVKNARICGGEVWVGYSKGWEGSHGSNCATKGAADLPSARPGLSVWTQCEVLRPARFRAQRCDS